MKIINVFHTFLLGVGVFICGAAQAGYVTIQHAQNKSKIYIDVSFGETTWEEAQKLASDKYKVDGILLRHGQTPDLKETVPQIVQAENVILFMPKKNLR